MGTLKGDKLKSVLEAIPAGLVVDAPWLEKHGVSRFLTRKYIESGFERGVFRRPAPQPIPLDWQTCLLSLQNIMN